MNIKPTICAVNHIGKGLLCVMPLPRYPATSLPYLRAYGLDKLVCLLEASEIDEFNMQHEASLCRQVGIKFEQFPIADGGVPANKQAFRQLVRQLHNELKAGATMGIHCLAGIGRTGILAACILVEDGYEIETALELLKKARGFPMPESETQYDFIWEYKYGPSPFLI